MKLSLDDLHPSVRQWDGPLTRDLVREPGKFGLGQVPLKVAPDATTTVVCGFCSTGCGLKVHLKNGEAVNLSAETTYPVNLGMACPKGWEALTPLAASDRATTPMLRNEATGELEPVDWERALVLFCERFKEIKAKHGPESVAFLSTGQIVTEEMALLGALWKFGLGFIHCDSNTRQCMATSHVAYKQSFGFDAPPFTYADFEESDVLVFIGANPCIAHPIMWQRVLRNRHNPEIICVDPRNTETAMASTQHYAIRPKSDLVLLYGLANILIAGGWIDRSYIEANTTGFREFAEFVTQFTTDRVSHETGLTPDELWHFAQTIRDGKRVSFWWTMGVNQSHESTRTAQAIIALALMTGNIGRPGTGANSITGQCNAMGSRLFANVTSLLGAHDVTNEEHRAKIAKILGIPDERIPTQPSLAYDEIVQGIEDGKIRGLWVIATNSSHSWIQQSKFNALLKKLDFLVVQDMYTTTETAQRADLVLPAAGWGEKEGTLINSERRIGLVKKVRRARPSRISTFSSSSPTTGDAARCLRAGPHLRPPSISCGISRADNPATSRASQATKCSTPAAASSGPGRKRNPAKIASPSHPRNAACSKTPASSPPTAKRASSTLRQRPSPNRPMPSTPSCSSPDAAPPHNGIPARERTRATSCAGSLRRVAMWRSIPPTRSSSRSSLATKSPSVPGADSSLPPPSLPPLCSPAKSSSPCTTPR
jgi:anaerobic selenocysteine-containing dehydrogenase